ncbi:hypothetical protein, partial, partial [Parasitella parasitica]
MLSDVASHISQLRSDNVCADNRLPSVPLVPPQRDPGLLLDALRIIEQTKHRQSLVDISSSQCRNRSRKRNGSSKPSQFSGSTNNVYRFHRLNRMFLDLCERVFAKAPIRPAGLKAAPATTDSSSSLPVGGRLAHFTQAWHL